MNSTPIFNWSDEDWKSYFNSVVFPDYMSDDYYQDDDALINLIKQWYCGPDVPEENIINIIGNGWSFTKESLDFNVDFRHGSNHATFIEFFDVPVTWHSTHYAPTYENIMPSFAARFLSSYRRHECILRSKLNAVYTDDYILNITETQIEQIIYEYLMNDKYGGNSCADSHMIRRIYSLTKDKNSFVNVQLSFLAT